MSWASVSLDSLCSQIYSGGTPSSNNEAYYGGNIPWLRTQEVIFSRIFDTEIKITDVGLKNSTAKWVPERSVIVAMYGNSAGRVAINEIPLTTNQACCNLILDRNKADYRYVFYALLQCFEALKGLSRGAAQNNLNSSQVKEFRIPSPPVHIQRAIGDILSAYDDLIENNRRRMALLEDSARLLYREWFVRLRFPGYEHTHIVDAIPDGWNKGVVSDFYDTSSGGTPSRKIPEYFTGEIPWVKTQELPNAFIIDTQEKITAQALKNSSAKLFQEKTVLVALYGATVGEVGILSMPATTNQACCAIIPLDERANYIHAFLFFRENKEKLVNLSAGAAQNNISQQIIRAFEMIMPSSSIMKIFVESLTPVFEQWLNLQRQNEKLRAARDLLLPRLMSGEIAV